MVKNGQIMTRKDFEHISLIINQQQLDSQLANSNGQR